MKRPGLPIATHIMMGAALVAVSHLSRAALRECKCPKGRAAILRFQAELDRLRCRLDSLLFAQAGQQADSMTALLARVYYGSAHPLSASELAFLTRCEFWERPPPVGAVASRYGLNCEPLHTLGEMARELSGLQALLKAMSEESTPPRSGLLS